MASSAAHAGCTAGARLWHAFKALRLLASSPHSRVDPIRPHPAKACCLHNPPPHSLLQRNNLTGAIPASWTQLSSLRRLVVRPGNPQLCGPIPAGVPFSVCTDEDVSCARQQPRLLEGPCAVAPAPAPGAAEPAAAPPAPGAPPEQGAEPPPPSGGGVNAAAIAAPVAVGVALLAAAGLGMYAAGRRRKRRREEAAARAVIERDSPPVVSLGRLNSDLPISGRGAC